jgi:hypothetical protein
MSPQLKEEIQALPEEDWKIWAELGRKMGYAEYFPWKDTEELHRELLKPSGITIEQLKQNPGGIIYREKKFQQYLKDGFNTPSKKVEIYSETMEKLGIDPIDKNFTLDHFKQLLRKKGGNTVLCRGHCVGLLAQIPANYPAYQRDYRTMKSRS